MPKQSLSDETEKKGSSSVSGIPGHDSSAVDLRQSGKTQSSKSEAPSNPLPIHDNSFLHLSNPVQMGASQPREQLLATAGTSAPFQISDRPRSF